jgi:hypothetical protein
MTIDYGSGLLGSWAGLNHAVTSNWATARVGLVGDSITSVGYDQLATALSAEYGATLAYDWWSGRPTAPAVDALLARDLWPEVLVMATGSNDIYSPFGTASGPSPTTTLGIVGDQIRRVLDAAPTTTQVVWVDVQVCRTSKTTTVQTADQRLSQAVNNQIHATAPHVVPWSWWLANSSMGGRLGSYLKDGVHPWDGPGAGHGDGTAFWCEIVMKTLRPLLDA